MRTLHETVSIKSNAGRLDYLNFISGENNVWADTLTRWTESGARRTSSFRAPLITEENPELRRMEVIVKSQEKYRRWF